MVNFLLRRLAYMIITVFFASIIGFIIIELPPGSYLDFELNRLRSLGGDVSQDQIKALELRYGISDPLPLKYWKWLSGFVQGDFGESFEYGKPVGDLIWGRLGFSLLLSFSALAFAWLVAIPIGVYSATHKYTLPDYIVTFLQFLGISVPSFLLALVLMVFSSQVLGWDVGGLYSNRYIDAPWSVAKFTDLLQHIWIPIVVIGASTTAGLTRVMRGNLLDVLNMQYVQTARAKGLKESVVIWKHAVRNAMHPLVMSLGGALPGLISSETIASIVLNLPSTGPLYTGALIRKDMYLAGTFLMFLVVLIVIGNFLADLLLAWVDPRIRLE